MIKNRALVAFIAIIFLNFFITVNTFAAQDIKIQSRYPDYSCEFCGKDSCEKFNRKLFVFNLKLNKCVIRPINTVWASIMPQYGIDRFQNFYNNVNYPIRLFSCLFQKDFKSSKEETVRFLTNTTLGVGGFFDPAKNIFKIEPHQEDMSQVLAHYKVKPGPYLVLPIFHGNTRCLVGHLLNCPFRPFSYIPIAGGAANAFFSLNNAVGMQSVIKRIDETYADPYEITKKVDGIQEYIKNHNLERRDFFKEEIISQELVKVNNNNNVSLDPDIKMTNYNPQSPLIDSLRTVLFENEVPKKSAWAEISVWNRSFSKKIKISSVSMDKTRPEYKYRYIMQKDKTAPLAIIYPSIGEGIHSDHSTTLAKLLYNEGYSIIIQGSSFQWEFVKSMPEGYCPGLPDQDAKYVRSVSAKILDNFEKKEGYNFSKKIIIGTSFGAMTALFVDAQEENDNTLGVSNYISICPPVAMFFSLDQLDKYCNDWKNDSEDIKLRAAIAAEKAVQVYKKISDKKSKAKCEKFPFNDDEAKLIIGFIMKQKLSDVIFAMENASRCKKCELYDKVNEMSFYDYGQKYLFMNHDKTPSQFDYESSLRSLASFLQKNKNYKIYHALDDFFVNQEQLAWLKSQTKDKSVFFSNGSHLGFLYRKEFLDEFKKDIKIDTLAPIQKEVPVRQLVELSQSIK